MKREAGAVFAEAVCALLVGAALLAVWTDGWRLEIVELTLSVRSVWRPIVIALVLLAARWSTRRVWPSPSELSDSLLRVCAGGLLSAGVLGWMTHVSPYLGGADSYGYVSAAERIRAGDLVHVEPLAAIVADDEVALAAAPLGYTPSPRVPHATVPVYPLGLPALMVLAHAIAGARAVFYVALVAGAALVAICVSLVYGWKKDAALALATGAAIAFHPVVFAYSIQPMSDVPAAAFYVGAAALQLRCHYGSAGALAGAAFLIRPALLPATAALALVAIVRKEWSLAGRFALTLGACVGLQAWLHWYLYGSPFASGYGSNRFGFEHLLPNIRSYGYWIAATHGLIWFLGLAIGLWVIKVRSARAVLVATLIGAVVPYVVYRTFDHWETQRFILPLLIAATAISVVGIFDISRRWLPRVGGWIAIALIALMVFGWTRWLDRERVLQLALSEQRYSLAATLVDRATPDNAVVLASLHSGSIRYYAKRETLDWAKIPPAKFDATIAALTRHGLPVYVLFDGDDERNEFVARHGDLINLHRWLPAGQRRNIRLFEVR